MELWPRTFGSLFVGKQKEIFDAFSRTMDRGNAITLPLTFSGNMLRNVMIVKQVETKQESENKHEAI